jgi:GcrA cell cycle regulator
MFWTNEKIEGLKTLWKQGVATKEIATKIGATSGHAVIGKARRLKLGEHPMNKDYIRKPKGEKPKWNVRSKKEAAPVEKVETIPPKKKPALPSPPIPSTSMVPEPPVVPISHRLRLVDLNQQTCKWPSGDFFSKDFSFCGNDADGPYCKYHSKLAFQPVGSRRRAR